MRLCITNRLVVAASMSLSCRLGSTSDVGSQLLRCHASVKGKSYVRPGLTGDTAASGVRKLARLGAVCALLPRVLIDGASVPSSVIRTSYARGDAVLASPPRTRAHSGPAVKHQ